MQPTPGQLVVPAGQATHWPPVQSSVIAQTFPHVPQLAESCDRSVHVPLQLTVLPGQTQSAFVHSAPTGQALPHAPQFAKLLWRSTHVPLQSTVAP